MPVLLIVAFVVGNLTYIGYRTFTGRRIETGTLLIIWILWAVLAAVVTGFYVF